MTGSISRSILNGSGTESLQESGLRKRQRATDSEAVARLESTHEPHPSGLAGWSVRFDTTTLVNSQSKLLRKTRARPNTYSEEISARGTPLLQSLNSATGKKIANCCVVFCSKLNTSRDNKALLCKAPVEGDCETVQNLTPGKINRYTCRSCQANARSADCSLRLLPLAMGAVYRAKRAYDSAKMKNTESVEEIGIFLAAARKTEVEATQAFEDHI